MKTFRHWFYTTLALLGLVVGVAYAQPIFSNNLFLLGGNAGVTPQIQALGTDTNISINLVPKGTGTVQINGAALPSFAGGNLTVAGNLVVTGTTQLTGAATTQVGTSGVFKLDGALALFHNITDAGTGADVTEDTLHTFTLPGNSLTTAGQYVRITSYVQTAANANAKQVRVYFGATVIGNSTSVAFNNQAFPITCDVYVLTGVTQKAYCWTIQSSPGASWAAAAGGGYNQTLPAETLTGAVVIKVTGQTGVATANDVVAKTTTVTWYPNGQ